MAHSSSLLSLVLCYIVEIQFCFVMNTNLFCCSHVVIVIYHLQSKFTEVNELQQNKVKHAASERERNVLPARSIIYAPSH